mmetsp:Transcript_34576/g.99584  ORF Transcript_34576/g.99584 Transcript_34576/m.99584 type:complete len:224 (-) Transcript_34576:88-759(-)
MRVRHLYLLGHNVAHRPGEGPDRRRVQRGNLPMPVLAAGLLHLRGRPLLDRPLHDGVDDARRRLRRAGDVPRRTDGLGRGLRGAPRLHSIGAGVPDPREVGRVRHSADHRGLRRLVAAPGPVRSMLGPWRRRALGVRGLRLRSPRSARGHPHSVRSTDHTGHRPRLGGLHGAERGYHGGQRPPARHAREACRLRHLALALRESLQPPLLITQAGRHEHASGEG